MSRSALLKKYGFKEEEKEILAQQFDKTGFPEPKKSYQLTYEVYDLSLETPYYWVLDALKSVFPIVDKLEDSFAAAENSAFFGTTQQRLGAQQDKISNFLITVGKLVKELFQMVRELRIIDERLDYYGEVDQELEKDLNKRSRGADITLKGFFVDLVQGGGKSPASVYGMARELQFVTLPDLFFDAPPFKTRQELENHVNSLEKDFNQNVLRVLLRHLSQYMQWRNRTNKEHQQRKSFMLKYLEQHYQIIHMYLTWLKPYLRHTKKLTMKGKNMASADLVSAFEGSMLDIEILARKKNSTLEVDDETKIDLWECILVTFNYRTRPELKVVQEGYQRGPIHIGKMDLNLRIYHWSDDDLKNYKALKEEEEVELLESVSSSVQQAMGALGEELKHYLKEARGEKVKRMGDVDKEEEEKPAKKHLLESLFGDFFNFKGKSDKIKVYMSPKEVEAAIDSFKKSSVGHAMANGWHTYNNFKKNYRMVTW